MTNPWAIVATCTVLLFSCSKPETVAPVEINLEAVQKISVLKNGKILLGKKEIKAEQLDSLFLETKKAQGAIWYYRESGHQVPVKPESDDIIERAYRLKVPVSLTTQPDFSDVIYSDGVPHPRKL